MDYMDDQIRDWHAICPFCEEEVATGYFTTKEVLAIEREHIEHDHKASRRG